MRRKFQYETFFPCMFLSGSVFLFSLSPGNTLTRLSRFNNRRNILKLRRSEREFNEEEGCAMTVKCPACGAEYDLEPGKYQCECGVKFYVDVQGNTSTDMSSAQGSKKNGGGPGGMSSLRPLMDYSAEAAPRNRSPPARPAPRR